MKKKFLKIITIFMAIGLVLSVISIVIYQVNAARKSAQEQEQIKLQTVSANLESNQNEIDKLVENTKDDYLDKARALAYILEQNPKLEESNEKLKEIRDIIGADEIHLIDEKGIIFAGTVEVCFGFNCHNSDQTIPFLKCIEDKNYELAQDAELNATEGRLFQYIGVPRRDKPGVVQIGMQPKRLSDALENNEIDNVLEQYEVGQDGYILAVNKESKQVEAIKEEEYIGKQASEIGITDKVIESSNGSGSIKINGQNMYYSSVDYGYYKIFAVIPTREITKTLISSVAILLISNAFIFIILIFVIMKTLDNQVIKGIKYVIEKLQLISKGNLDVVVDGNSNDEFKELSLGINEMVVSIKDKIDESKSLIEETQKLNEVQERVFEDVKKSSKEITIFADQMLHTSEELSKGSIEQSNAVINLSYNIDEVFNGIKNNSSLASNAKSMVDEVRDKLVSSNEKIRKMTEAMEKISDTSGKIGEIIAEIDEISSQSNLLALNAAIEASRAGEQGKSFAIIANEIGELANRSMKSSGVTNQLIENTLMAIEEGIKCVDETIVTIEEIMTETSKVTEVINQVVIATNEQPKYITVITEKMENISAVVEENSTSAEVSEEASRKLAKQAKELNNVVNK